ncbi:MAG: hypothetical protein KF857_12820 [Fimbriimonadaceae bacterium]|nr:hypothetical protein [Fimbriimonadaceae bacterium]
MRAFSVALLVGLLVSPALATQDKVDLTWKPKVGETKKYKLEVNMSLDLGGQTGDIKVSMINVNKTTKIDGDKVTTEGSIEKFTMAFNGNEADPSQAGGPDPSDVKTIQVRSLKTGEVLSTETTGTGEVPPQNPRIEAMGFFWRPDVQAKVGDSWTKELKKDEKKGTEASTAKFTAAGEEVVLGKKCWKVTYAYTETGIEKPFGATGTFWIDQADGTPVKYEANYENVVFQEGLPPTSAKVSMVLVS